VPNPAADGAPGPLLRAGGGRPILLVHGWGTSGEVWARQVPGLAEEGYEAIAPTLRGFGGASAGQGELPALYPRDLKALIDGDGLDGVLLVGWSMGGLAVLSYLREYGTHRLGGLCIVDVSPRAHEAPDWPVGTAVGAGFAAGLARWQELWPEQREAVFEEHATLAFAEPEAHAAEIEWMVGESLKADPEVALRALVEFAACDFRELLARIELPTLLLFGGRSSSTTPWLADYMRGAIVDSRVVTFAASGHALMLEEPPRFTATLADFAGAL
jgi:pimeloyl-ACP methyl ester carboxylesterase